MRFVRNPAVAASLALVAVLGACVDHEANAASFCRAVDHVVDDSRDGEALDADTAREVADDVAVAMRDAEDATRSVRRAARDMSVAYDELAAILSDEDARDDEIGERRDEVESARRDVRSSCAARDK